MNTFLKFLLLIVVIGAVSFNVAYVAYCQGRKATQRVERVANTDTAQGTAPAAAPAPEKLCDLYYSEHRGNLSSRDSFWKMKWIDALEAPVVLVSYYIPEAGSSRKAGAIVRTGNGEFYLIIDDFFAWTMGSLKPGAVIKEKIVTQLEKKE